jgi:hypothetical protein
MGQVFTGVYQPAMVRKSSRKGISVCLIAEIFEAYTPGWRLTFTVDPRSAARLGATRSRRVSVGRTRTARAVIKSTPPQNTISGASDAFSENDA